MIYTIHVRNRFIEIACEVLENITRATILASDLVGLTQPLSVLSHAPPQDCWAFCFFEADLAMLTGMRSATKMNEYVAFEVTEIKSVGISASHLLQLPCGGALKGRSQTLQAFKRKWVEHL